MDTGQAPPTAAVRRAVAAVAVVIAAAIAVHTGATFFHLTPANAVSEKHKKRIDAYLQPEFQQAWNLFGPDITRDNTKLYARAGLGGGETSRWVEISAADQRELHHNLLPSHSTAQLRKAWNNLVRWSDAKGNPYGQPGADARELMMRMTMLRLAGPLDEHRIERIQVRAVTSKVPPPPWKPQPGKEPETARDFPWWSVSQDDIPEGGAR